ncbi:TPA: hypothetical protein ACP3ZG_000536 [Pseudomonas aeruginosa]|uniref:Uncharacterized protein n=1 Tax=Pseudomonas aeruginosa TaxID=287 RepID=A0A241XRE3_PSEAI|nr:MULTISPECIES: hypothetical protein [Pseudomonas]ELG7184135.1 hypothetical protein [Pseudomonas aeruginosa]MBI6602687.1 hypothetical protein [Pseudomonas sp. S4_EA_1b]MBI8852300.1 hypothetical protein [Pseudomonas aeruginosa]OBY57094.1 hypothetical protein A9513_016415 [Pseudomonas sp. AU12215]OTI63059.1 hypothetical protein CAZ10_09465 [Pseudomonas aeruginosa]
MAKVRRFYAPGLDGLARSKEFALREMTELVLGSDYDSLAKELASNESERLKEKLRADEAERALVSLRDQLEALKVSSVAAYAVVGGDDGGPTQKMSVAATDGVQYAVFGNKPSAEDCKQGAGEQVLLVRIVDGVTLDQIATQHKGDKDHDR